MKVLHNVKELLHSLRKNGWHITAFEFFYNGHEYVVVFEDLRANNEHIQFYSVKLTFIDKNNKNRIFETYVNSCGFINDMQNKKAIKNISASKAVCFMDVLFLAYILS